MTNPNQLLFVSPEALALADDFDRISAATLAAGREHKLDENKYLSVNARAWQGNETASAHSYFRYKVSRVTLTSPSAIKTEEFRRGISGSLECEIRYAEQDVGDEYGVYDTDISPVDGEVLADLISDCLTAIDQQR